MEKLLRITRAFIYISLVVFYAQSLAAVGQSTPHKIEFTKLSDYVNDWDKRHDGERLVVTNVPAFDNMKFEKRYNMYLLAGTEQGDVGNTFYTSPILAKLLLKHLGTLNESLRISCTLIQFASGQDVYRSPFATKIEGVDENGTVTWTANGPVPQKLKLRE